VAVIAAFAGVASDAAVAGAAVVPVVAAAVVPVVPAAGVEATPGKISASSIASPPVVITDVGAELIEAFTVVCGFT
jgi:hypothetical protein